MTLFNLVNGENVPLTDEDLKQREIDEQAHQERVALMNTWPKRREKEYQEKIDPFLLTALSEHYLDADSSKLDALRQIKSDIKSRYPKE